MYLDKRKRKDGTVQYRFTYLDKDGKRRRFPQSKVPHFETERQYLDWALGEAGKQHARRAEAERKLSWRSRFLDFEKLLERYAAFQKERAPNSWESAVFYLEHWVFPFFLMDLGSNNPNDWYLSFEQFRDWLREGRGLERRGRKEPLAISTQNNIIKALNTFLFCLKKYNLIDPSSAQKCEAYPEHRLNRRTMDDLVLEPERDQLIARLRTSYPPAADFLLVAWHTGMRFGELFGLPMGALFRGPIPPTLWKGGSLEEGLEKAGLTPTIGYLYLESQPVHDDCRREKDGSILRKPLKGARIISPRFSRVIPISSKEVWNVLARRYKDQQALLLEKRYGPDRANYRLFDDGEWNRMVNGLREAYRHLGLRPKGYHSCRHTFVTFLVGRTGSYMLTRLITGHRSQGAFERYLHLFEQVSIKAQQSEQDIDVV